MTHTYIEDFATFASNGGGQGPAWAPAMRRSAIDRFASLGFPTPKNEDWHFTSVAPIVEREFRAGPAESSQVRAADLAPFIFNRPEWPALVFVNGRFASGLSTLGTLPRGTTVSSLAHAWEHDEPLLAQYLGKLATYEEQAFTALNTAFMKDGALVSIPADTVVELPIHLIFVSDANAAKSVAHPRNLIVAGRNSKATVIESYVSVGDAAYFTNTVTEAVVEEGATLTHYKIQRESQRAYHVGTVDVRQGRDSHFVSFSFATGAALSRTNIYTVLEGPGCGATLNGLYMVSDQQHVDHQTRIEHAQPNCFSRELYKGILDGASHGVFNGKVYVHPIAQQTDGKQSNNNLLLSDKARIDTKPQLEIFADDVKCTHGATVGRIDEQALFYMKSRGVNRELATQLLTYAFAADVLEQLEVTEVKEELERMTMKRFTQNESWDER